VDKAAPAQQIILKNFLALLGSERGSLNLIDCKR